MNTAASSITLPTYGQSQQGEVDASWIPNCSCYGLVHIQVEQQAPANTHGSHVQPVWGREVQVALTLREYSCEGVNPLGHLRPGGIALHSPWPLFRV